MHLYVYLRMKPVCTWKGYPNLVLILKSQFTVESALFPT